jgi:hypothetical protein
MSGKNKEMILNDTRLFGKSIVNLKNLIDSSFKSFIYVIHYPSRVSK